MKLLLLFLFLVSLAHARPSDLDPTFGVGGKVVTDFGENHEIVALSLQKDGKILAAGSSKLGSAWVLVRYLTNGTLDTTFGEDGKAFTSFGDPYASCSSMSVDGAGRIILAGKSGSSYYDCDFAAARYDANGILDLSFGESGRIKTPVSKTLGAESVLIQKDGKIVVSGSGFTGRWGIVLIRYEIDGALDQTFGSGGIATVPLSTWVPYHPGFGTGKSVLQPDGKIVVAGALASKFVVARVNSTGDMDLAFGKNGKCEEPYGNFEVAVNSLFLAKNGGIVLTGDGAPSEMTVLKFSRDGFPRPSPLSVTFSKNLPGSPTAFSVDKEGNFLIAGSHDAHGEPQFFSLARFMWDGALDPAFGEDSVVVTKFSEIYDVPNAMVIQTDGKIITAGFSSSSPKRGMFALARYEGGQVRPDIRIGWNEGAWRDNNRYNTFYAPPALQSVFPPAGGTELFHVAIQNDGTQRDSFILRGSRGDLNFSTRYFRGKRDVTESILNGTYRTPALEMGQIHRLRLQITAKRREKAIWRDFQIRAVSITDKAARDCISVSAYGGRP